MAQRTNLLRIENCARKFNMHPSSTSLPDGEFAVALASNL
jgi:hypothetical protein